MPSGRASQAAFTYLLLLVVLAIVSLFATASISLGATMARHSAEEELLAIGAEYERALVSFQAATPAGAPARAPKALSDLLRDPRYAATRRYLRKVYADPLTGSDTWGLVRAPDGTIACVYSLAEGSPIQQSGFIDRREGFNKATTYANWCFGR